MFECVVKSQFVQFKYLIKFCFRTTRETKILGYPIQIIDQKYLRNAYYFNLCIVCDHNSHTLQYEPLVKKLSSFLVCTYDLLNLIYY